MHAYTRMFTRPGNTHVAYVHVYEHAHTINTHTTRITRTEHTHDTQHDTQHDITFARVR